jgi:hypothetical protein
MAKFGKRETAEPVSKGVVETVKSAASNVAAKVTGSGADFFTSGVADSKRTGNAWKVEQAGVQTDENGRQYRTVNAWGEREYSDGYLPGRTQAHVAPGMTADNVGKLSGSFRQNRIRQDVPILTTDERNARNGIASRAMEWFENILAAGSGIK